MSLIEITSLRKLLRKALLYQIMTNVDEIIYDANPKLTHKEVSAQTGRIGNWFNDAFNNNEDIKLSSLAKVLSVVNQYKEIKHYHLSDLFNEKVLKISSVMASLADEETTTINNFIISEKELFVDLLADWGSLNSKRKLSSDEQSMLELIKELANKEDKPNV